ncbi:MAG: Gfo/Idh/MocA family oxidoreductase [Candidatus Aenigmarchaeota archaeon]|nr:Gfo/Idh/MocA family oxidoreductase [Candidatus Aenigmarchaeota archaeon]
MVLNVAVIGTGNMGRNHIRTYSEIDDAKLVAISDVIEDRGKGLAEKFGCRFYKDYNEMFKKEKIDIVSICVPTFLHKKVAKDVISHGVNFLIEKPIARNVEEGEEIVKLARKKGLKMTVGHIERFNPAVQKLKAMIDEGKLGNITSVLARRVGIFPPQIKDANVVIDLAVHDIDVINYLLGKSPDKVYAGLGKALIEKRHDYANIFLKYNGANAFIEVNWITPVKIRRLSVTGTKGYAELNYITQELIYYESIYDKFCDDFGDFVINFGEPNITKVNIKKEEPLKVELKHFIDCIENNKEPIVTGEQALEALRVSEMALNSNGCCQ